MVIELNCQTDCTSCMENKCGGLPGNCVFDENVANIPGKCCIYSSYSFVHTPSDATLIGWTDYRCLYSIQHVDWANWHKMRCVTLQLQFQISELEFNQISELEFNWIFRLTITKHSVWHWITHMSHGNKSMWQQGIQAPTSYSLGPLFLDHKLGPKSHCCNINGSQEFLTSSSCSCTIIVES